MARADADAALARVRGQASRASVREDKDAGVSTFRVMLPNVGDRAAAQALVKRIAAAGMGDYYVIAQGEDNTVALGQYQSRERAERRQAAWSAQASRRNWCPAAAGNRGGGSMCAAARPPAHCKVLPVPRVSVR